MKSTYIYRILTLLFSWMAYSMASYGQYDGSVPQIAPMAPEEAALYKLSERPAGSFNGTTPIGFPLHTLSCGEIAVPVSINYNNGGIKVEEVAGNVGLGWSLSAGGSITRAMNGIPDDEQGPGTGYLHMTLKPSAFPGTSYLINSDYILRGYYDIEPDLYYYNFNGYSGKFYFDESGNVMMNERSPIVIQPVYQSSIIKGWIITDDRGAKYYFGLDKAQSTTVTDNSALSFSSMNGYTNIPSAPSYISTWHLLEIHDMNDENFVRFDYSSASSSFQSRVGSYQRLIPGGGTSDCTSEDSYTDEVYVTTTLTSHYVTKISCRNGYLIFGSTADRLDYGGSKLNFISIFDSTGSFKKQYNFNYGYFAASGAGPGYDQLNKRLKLTGFTEYGVYPTDSLRYKFDYNESVNLPSHLSRGLDYWGYYNGQDYNWTLLPNIVYTAYGITVRYANLGERHCNAYYSVANTLTKITYPTGGYRQFQYEGNQALLEYGDQLQPDPAYLNYQSFYNDTFNFINPTTPACTQTFTVNSNDGGTTFSYYLDGYSSGSFSVKLYKVVGMSSTLIYTFSNMYNGSWDLTNGNYKVQVFYDYSGSFTDITGNWNESTLSTGSNNNFGLGLGANNRDVGGIRTKEIDDYDPVTGKTAATTYSYKWYSTDSTLTSGILVTPMTVAHQGNCSFRDCQEIKLYSSPCYPLATAGGSYVVYPEVRTRENQNGYTDRTYSYVPDGDGMVDVSQYPLFPPEDHGWQRDKLLIEKYTDASGNLIKKASTVYPYIWNPDPDWVYTTAPNDSTGLIWSYPQYAWKLIGYYHDATCGSGILCAACWNEYDLTSQFMGPLATLETTYSPYGNQVVKTQYYYYKSLGQPLLKQTQVTINNNHTREVNYKYAFNNTTDFSFPLSAAEQSMKSTLLINNYLQPLETTVTLTPTGGSSTLREGNKYSYGYFNTSKIHLARLLHFTSPLDSIVTNFGGYDAHGNLNSQYKSADPQTVYLWGYNYGYPVAKIVGSDYSTCMSYVTNSVLQSPTSDNDIRTQINNIRTGLAGTQAQVTSYTWSPLFGVSSETDPSGKITYYEYDIHGRLSRVRDQNRNIIKQYQYNYNNF
jgi:YD repeat-containing protein